ncbi:hypothetical protein A6A04_04265 [Paramagnetospirillum marisnigri]|uniref:Uncharacterized protein n=1 Tax=Paramagnetospirillum marisnigri TaxID=1285242 RepID=A0A178MH18_9PROT|nr:hypothetical protein [Paramagnetospirillum marisnigri]OAN47982.1 hypothetical protein A6A04_04265 [Paramagnetospirillum marisnigri]
MASAAEIIAVIRSLPSVPFARLEVDDTEVSLVYEGRALARVGVASTDRPTLWSANQMLNDLAHQALFQSDIKTLAPAEAVNAAHQVLEWWDAVVCAIARENL